MLYHSACAALIEQVLNTGSRPALIGENALICNMRLITREYSNSCNTMSVRYINANVYALLSRIMINEGGYKRRVARPEVLSHALKMADKFKLSKAHGDYNTHRDSARASTHCGYMSD